jgi:succinate dehydrogenase / fumarate reductase cytochrome b subunit
MHGWFHVEWWATTVSGPLGGARFHPYNAASSAGLALQSPLAMVIYVIGVLACVYHLANGIWTMGITWGVWTTPAAMRRALRVCAVFGVLLAVVALGALWGMGTMNIAEARARENQMREAKVESGLISEEEALEKSASSAADRENAAANPIHTNREFQ